MTANGLDDLLSAIADYLTDIHLECSCLSDETVSIAQAACNHPTTLEARKSLAVHVNFAKAMRT